jgi:TusA-related sulfurtransferase
MILDLRDLSGDEPFKRVREVLKDFCPEDEVVEVLLGSEALAKRMKGFMAMSGCNVDLLRTQDAWIVKVTGRNCYCG